MGIQAATVLILLGWVAPYEIISLPKLFGILGGLGLLVGPAGLFYLKLKRDPASGDGRQLGMDMAFIALLWLSSLSGLVLMLFRESSALGLLLVIHLGIVLALFVTLPYGIEVGSGRQTARQSRHGSRYVLRVSERESDFP